MFCLHVCLCTKCIPGAQGNQKRATVVVGCRGSAGNQIQVLSKSSQYSVAGLSLHHSHLQTLRVGCRNESVTGRELSEPGSHGAQGDLKLSMQLRATLLPPQFQDDRLAPAHLLQCGAGASTQSCRQVRQACYQVSCTPSPMLLFFSF